jgi:multicomponent Na+:H+ antiporter subunit E
MKSLLCILLTFGLWLLLTWSLDVRVVAVGAVMAMLVATLLAHIYPENLHKVFDPRRWFWMAVYVPYFLYLCIRSNLDVAYRVLHPDMPIRPGIVKVRTGLKSEMAKTFLANSITLTPGTMSVDISGQDLYIHWINVKGETVEDHTARIVRPFEGLLRRIFE